MISFHNFKDIRLLVRLAVCLLFVGIAARLSPFLDMSQHLFWQFMTEDGYLMQTVARNMAIGLGMSTAEGTIPTNGVQPLATILFAGMHYLAGGDKTFGVIAVTLFSTIIALISTYFLFRLVKLLFSHLSMPDNYAYLLAALWFASPLIIRHSMNGLETGLYYLMIILSLRHYFSLTFTQGLNIKCFVSLGILLGFTFLARNDAVFFIASLLTSHLVWNGLKNGFQNRLIEACVAGLISILIGLPWLIFNYLSFGSIVPISGKAESFSAAIGENIQLIPAHGLEAATLFLPIPQQLEQLSIFPLFALACLIGIGVLFWRVFATKSDKIKLFATFTYLYFGCIGLYYGLFFGAAWFVTRYISALTPSFWIMSFSLLGYLALKLKTEKLISLVAVILFSLTIMLESVAHINGTKSMHTPVVNWVVANVNEDTWAGAVQTGTLGYFHDKTINLDGKTNPDALNSLLENKQILTYVISTKIDYIVDWSGICDWVNNHAEPAFGNTFKVEVRDTQNNLCVLKRI